MTDEQRGRFHVWRGRYFDEIDLSLMTPTEAAAYKSAFQAGLQARDAEVRKLRELVSRAERLLRNAEVRAGYCACGDGPDEHSQDHVYLDMGEEMAEQWLKGAAALRGEEGANHE